MRGLAIIVLAAQHALRVVPSVRLVKLGEVGAVVPDLLQDVHVLAHLLCSEREILLPSLLSDAGHNVGHARDDLSIDVVSWVECVNRAVEMAHS